MTSFLSNVDALFQENGWVGRAQPVDSNMTLQKRRHLRLRCSFLALKPTLYKRNDSSDEGMKVMGSDVIFAIWENLRVSGI